jgi:hypothetical protein
MVLDQHGVDGCAALENLSSPGRQVTIDLKTNADKDNAVPGRVAAVPLDLAIGHYKTPSIFDVRAPEWFVVAFVSDDGDVLIVLHLLAVGPIGILAVGPIGIG